MEEKNYLDFVPNEFISLVRKKCKYDIEKHKWFTTDKNNTIINFLRKNQLTFGH
jgi:hypothetical protein